MPAQHIAGLPVEEILLAAIAAATPMIALIGWEIRDRVRRLRQKLRQKPSGSTTEAAPDSVPEVQ
jgi:hypothetical protein